jgi:HAMP domain-containing protein
VTLSIIIAIVAALLGLAALAWALSLQRRLDALGRARKDAARMAADGDVQGLAQHLESRIDGLVEDGEKMRADDAALADRVSRSIRHVSLLRYDAFPHAAGEQSFTLAMLDDAADGFVLTSIYGRGEHRMYAKPVAAGGSRYPMTDEEKDAVHRAIPGGTPGSVGRAGADN